MKYEQYVPKELEPIIVNFWKKEKVLDKLKKRNKRGERFYFLNGPPYTSGRIHLGQAWNNTVKDIVLRYKRMQSFNVWDRAGYDMHGLPTEHKVMEKFNLKTKEDIVAFGVEKFSDACFQFSTEMAEQMNKDLIRLGSTLDFSDPYLPVTNEFMESEWFLIKRAHEQNRLYEGERAMSWCSSCATALAKHELEYKDIADTSIYLKFRLKDAKNEYLIIWTTTPWTIPLNLAVVVHPKFEYVKCKVKDEYWIVAKALAEKVIKNKIGEDYKVIQTFLGKELKGKEYIPPFAEEFPYINEAKKEQKKIYTILLSEEYVNLEDGTGLVHFAPGCGDSDYELCTREGIKPFNVIDEYGAFPKSHKTFGNLVAKKDDKKFADLMEKNGSLIAKETYNHSYAHCWRCHKPIVYRTTKQWFFKVDDLKNAMLKANESILWVPEEAKNAFTSWLENLRDNSITKQRFWGTPVPIWRCNKCKSVTVIGSIKELKKLAVTKLPKNLHKPWIDEVAIKCSCGNEQRRIPDILDVWIDAGTTSWSCLYYPQRADLFEEWYPADFITEGKDQIRGWFNMLTVASFLAFNKPSFKSVYMHGFVTDVEGVKMSKSLGNIVSPYEIVDKYSADVLRCYTSQTRAGEDMNFSWDEITIKHRNLLILWNLHKFLIQLTRENDRINPFRFSHNLMHASFDIEEKFIFSKLNSTIKKVTELMNAYRIDEAIKPIEDLYLDLSRTYIQLVRDKGSIGSKEEKHIVMFAVSHVLLESLKLFSIISPFITEMIYQNLREEYKLKEDSIHLYEWPKADAKFIDLDLERDMNIAQTIIQAGANIREQLKISVRWPIKEAVITTINSDTITAVKRMSDVIKNQLNVKEIQIMQSFPAVKTRVKPDFEKINPKYGELTPKIIAKLAVESSESILKHIEQDGAYKFRMNGSEIHITKEDLLIEHDIAYPYKAADFSAGTIYLNQERTEDLEAEGFARELMRRIQSLRKKSGLEKTDDIVLHIKASAELTSMLSRFEKDISIKCGASRIRIDSAPPARKHQTTSAEKIKNEEFEVSFDKV